MKANRVLELIDESICFHPIIRESQLTLEDKFILQDLLENKFNNEFSLLIEDMMKYAVEVEEYEMAALIRDELKKQK